MPNYALPSRRPRGGVRLPQLGFRTFLNVLVKIAQAGVPQTFDAAAFDGEGTSRTMTTLYRHALLFLGLMDHDGRPTDAMYEFARLDEAGRKKFLYEVGLQAYAPIVEVARRNGSQEELNQAVEASGLSGSSIEKGANFYVAFAEYTGLPISQQFRRPRGSRGESARTTPNRRRESGRRRVPSAAEDSRQSLQNGVPSAFEERRAAYADLLMQLATQSAGQDGEVNPDLLDRIERTLGMGGIAPGSSHG